MNVQRGIMDALKADAELVALLGVFSADPAIHTRRQAPGGTGTPFIIVNPNTTVTNETGVRGDRPVVSIDVTVYGDKAEEGQDYRDVELAANRVRKIFLPENKSILTVADFHVSGIDSSGPIPAPVDDDTKIGRVVTVEVRLVAT